MAKKAKPYKYVAPKPPEISPETASELEKILRDQIDAAFHLQEEKDELKERLPWLYALLFHPRRHKKYKKY